MEILSSEHLREGQIEHSSPWEKCPPSAEWVAVVFLWERQGTHAEEGSLLRVLSTQDWAQGPGRWWTLLLVSVFTMEK